jgi:oligopeptide/dipeptide ABC transporter ATP-binding protein
MLKYIIKRALWVIPTLLGVLIILFSLTYLMPGDPASAMLGPRATPELVAELNQRLHLDRAMPVRLGYYLLGIVKGDLGTSVWSGHKVKQQAIERLNLTGIADPEARISNYPFEFSGGMKQRVMIGMALSSGTSLLLADEATTALDVTIEAQINRLITKLAAEYGTSILYVTHNLGVLAEMADRIMIMYAGRIFEMGKTADVFGSPRHPYSAALLESLPSRQSKGKRLLSIPGFVPPLDRLPEGCSFHPRCAFAEDICRQEAPSLTEVASGHWSACLSDQKRGRQKWQWI